MDNILKGTLGWDKPTEGGSSSDLSDLNKPSYTQDLPDTTCLLIET